MAVRVSNLFQLIEFRCANGLETWNLGVRNTVDDLVRGNENFWEKSLRTGWEVVDTS